MEEFIQKDFGKGSERYNKEFINKKRAFGELGHPDGWQ